MKRSVFSLLALPLVFSLGCPDGKPLPPADAGSDLPDAVVIGPRDAGDQDAGVVLPTASSVSPATGPETGGTRVTIRGTSFREPAEVSFGDLPATSVVVLDEVSIACTTPAHAVGSVTVKVTTGGGVAELPEGFFFHRELRIDAIEPARLPDEGGVAIAIVGKGFDEDTILFMDRQPVRGLTWVSDTRMTGYAPALEPGRPDVRAMNRDAEARRGDVVVVYGTPDLTAVLPGYGPVAGRAAQEIAGDGLSDAEQVTLGGVPARSYGIESDALLTAESPVLTEGLHDVTIANSDASGTLAGGYVAYGTALGIAVLGVLPNRVAEGSGALITVVGRGFGTAPQLAIDGVRVPLIEQNANAVTALVPQALALGLHDLSVLNGATMATLTGGLEIFAPIQVTSISPTAGPASGGTAVTITGRGFSAGVAEVRIADVPLADLVVVSDTEITGTTVAGSHGTHDVRVKIAAEVVLLENAFTFSEPFAIIRVDPSEGSIAGNTYVSVFGRGFTAPAAVQFGGVDAASVQLENGAIIGARTQPARSGTVDVRVNAGADEENLNQAFSFYDPRLLTGGAWGGPIEGSVNVAVQTFDGTALAGMVVQLGFEADLRYAAITNENGEATISSPEIRGAQTVTVGAPGVEFVTYYEVDARNLTMFASPYPQSMPPDAPLSPCPMGGQAPLVRGRIYKFKSSLDPTTMPGWVPVARITYTQPNVFTANPPDPPEQFDFVFQEGGEYEIVVLRVGTVAVYAELGDYNAETQQFIPRKMGIARNVPVAVGGITEGIDIALDIDLDQTTRIRLDNPPEQKPGPSINAVFPFLNLASEGVIAWPPTAVFGNFEIVVPNLPNLPESAFFYMGGSFTQSPTGGLRNPWSLTLLESSAPFAEGVDLGPFLQMPQNINPKPLALLEEGVISWDQGGVRPDLTTINVVDSVFVSGCCCPDANMNGQCEPTEPPQCGGLPQQFDRWTMFAEGGLASYVLPRMVSGVIAFDAPNSYPWIVQNAIAPRFNYDEFIYNQFSPFFWKSWATTFSQFTVKEETD